jgi:hypothetical protein
MKLIFLAVGCLSAGGLAIGMAGSAVSEQVRFWPPGDRDW